MPESRERRQGAAAAGLYLATAGQDCKLVVWELRSKAQVAMETSPAALVSMDWRPEGNCLLCMTVEGKLLLWKNAVPSGHRGPCEAGDALRPMSASLSDGRTDSHTEGVFSAICVAMVLAQQVGANSSCKPRMTKALLWPTAALKHG